MIRVLVVDDESVILRSFKKAFENKPIEIETSESAERAVEKLRSGDFDLMFTDMKMPGMDGLTLLREAGRINPTMDKVLMTGYSTVESAVNAMKFGALDYITKPFSTDELHALMNKVIGMRQQRIKAQEESVGFKRFNLNLRIQHLVMIVSFSLLTLTGVPFFFPEFFKGVMHVSETSVVRGMIHRISAVVMILLSLYHILYIMFTDDGHLNLKLIFPKIPKDIIDAFHMVQYNLGIRKYPPKFGKYDFIEKFEYFAVIWGTLVMVISGLMLWFANAVMTIFPVWIVDVARIVHHYEAILAILSIAIWHMYNVHLKPEHFPMNRVWLTGRIDRKTMLLHHTLEYERTTGQLVDIEQIHSEEKE
jgi:formate dehydrogenase subunit gamma